MYSISDSITEVHGKKDAVFVLMSCYIISFILSIFVRAAVSLPSPPGWQHQEGYNYIFIQGPWIIMVGFIGFMTSMLLNITVLDKLRWKLRGRHFILRSIISSSLGELILTLTYPLIFEERGGELLVIMASAYAFKVMFSIIGAFPAKLVVFLLRYIDGIKEESYHAGFHVLEKS